MAQRLDVLRERYDFASWRATSAPPDHLFIWRFQLFGNELSGLVPARIQQVTASPEPPATLSVWRPAGVEPSGSESSTLIAVDVFESPSRGAAREHLLRMLGEFQGPALTRRQHPGDVAFGFGETVVLFVRANLVALVRSVERMPIPVMETATRLDEHLTVRPSTPDTRGPTVLSFRAADGRAPSGGPQRLVIEVDEPRKRPVWFKFFSTAGEISLVGDAPAYFGAGAGQDEILLVAIDPEGHATTQTLRL